MAERAGGSMPREPDRSRPSPADLARALLAVADPAARGRGLDELARRARTAPQRVVVATVFLSAGDAGRLAALEWMSRERGPVPPGFLIELLPRLADDGAPAPLRVAAAAGLLRAFPDRPATVRAIAKALAHGPSPLRGLERLRHLQNRLADSPALDDFIEGKERRVKVVCPRCGVRFPRREMVEHIWVVHRAAFRRGVLAPPAKLVAEHRARYSDGGDPGTVDRAWLAVSSADPGTAPREAHRAWLAGDDPEAEELAPLLEAAGGRGCGLCPNCFGEVPACYEPLPEPLAVGAGRIAGNGYEVVVGSSEWFQTDSISAPSGVLRNASKRRRTPGPRGAAAPVAALLVLSAVAVAAYLPHSLGSPVPYVSALLAAALAAYATAALSPRPLSQSADRAFDLTWEALAERCIGRERALPFLARLCRTSLGRGDPEGRARTLARLCEWLEGPPGKPDAGTQACAAAAVLRIVDAGRLGRDTIAEVADLAAQVFDGGKPLPFAEYVLVAYLDRPDPPDEGDRARLCVLLHGGAFEAGLKPEDLSDVWAVAPALGRAMDAGPPHRPRFLYAAWSAAYRPATEWGETLYNAFDLCRSAPFLSRRLLLEAPDLLFAYRPPAELEAELGPILLCGRGVVVAGKAVGNPAAIVEVQAAEEGGYELTVGPHGFTATTDPGEAVPDAIRALLRFRHEVLLPIVDRRPDAGAPAALDRLLAPLARPCRRCGRPSAAIAGRVGIDTGTDAADGTA